MRKSKRTSIIGIIITIIVLVVIVIVSNIKIENVTHLESGVGVLVMPIQNGLTYFKIDFTETIAFYEYKHITRRKWKTKTKNSELEQSLRELEIIKSENNTLKEYVNLKEKI